MKLTGHKADSVFRRYDIVSLDDLHVAVERLFVLLGDFSVRKHRLDQLLTTSILGQKNCRMRSQSYDR
jgi:hypothetical protein